MVARKLTQQQAEDIRRRIIFGEKLVAVASEYGIDPSTAWRIARGDRYVGHVVEIDPGSSNGIGRR
jgi:hypothetical protein